MLDKACALGRGEACAYVEKHRDALRREKQAGEPPESEAASEE